MIREYDNALLSTYRDCPRKFFYFGIRGLINKEGGPGAAFGTSIHVGKEAFDRGILGGLQQKASVEASITAFKDMWTAKMPPRYRDPSLAGDKRGLANGETLLRGFLNKYGDHRYKVTQVEVPFACVLGRSPGGIEVIYKGRIDDIRELDGQLYVSDLKTTVDFPGTSYMERYRVSSALMGYQWACEQTFGVEMAGCLIQAIWINTHTPRSKYRLEDYFREEHITFTDEQIEEWKVNTLATVDEIERSNQLGFWRMNLGNACGQYGECQYRNMCRLGESQRKFIEALDFKEEQWSPGI